MLILGGEIAVSSGADAFLANGNGALFLVEVAQQVLFAQQSG